MAEPASILIVEDETMVALFLDRAVRKAGYDVVGPFDTVPQAMEAIAAPDIPIDAAILDLSLRDNQTSMGIARELRGLGIPFAFLTGDDSTLTPDSHDGNVPRRVLIKPVPLAVLFQTLRDMVNSPQD